MTSMLNRWLPSLMLACWSAILLYFSISGRLAAFLHPAFRPGVAVAGAILLLFAIGLAAGGPAAACCEEDACGHALTRPTVGKLFAFAVLWLPLLLAFESPRAGFGVTAIENRGVTTDAAGLSAKARTTQASAPVQMPLPGESTPPNNPGPANGSGTPDQYIPKTANGAIAASVIDLLYAAQDPSLRVDFEGKTVEIVGQLMAQKPANPNTTRMKLVRMFMTCCAADARPVAALVELPGGTQTTALPDLAWVRVVGKPAFPFEGGRTIAVLKADTIAVTDPPEDTMLY